MAPHNTPLDYETMHSYMSQVETDELYYQRRVAVEFVLACSLDITVATLQRNPEVQRYTELVGEASRLGTIAALYDQGLYPGDEVYDRWKLATACIDGSQVFEMRQRVLDYGQGSTLSAEDIYRHGNHVLQHCETNRRLARSRVETPEDMGDIVGTIVPTYLPQRMLVEQRYVHLGHYDTART